MGSCISCKTNQRRFSQSGQSIGRIKIRSCPEVVRVIELHRVEFVEISLMISERSKPPQVMKLENNYTFKLTSENECVLSNCIYV